MSDLKKATIGGAVFTIIFGTLLHFVFQWSRNNPIVGIVGAVNESTWEHLKLLFFPMLFYTIFEYFAYGKDTDNFIPARAVSILAGMFIIVSSFYTYTGILGKNLLPLDIGTFILGTVGTYIIGYKIMLSNALSSKKMNFAGIVILILLIFSFAVFTFSPPEIGLFLDPATGKYAL